MGDPKHDYIFTMMNEPSFSPAIWNTTYWQIEGSLEMPTLVLSDPRILPPKNLTLSSSDNATTFYEGNYTYMVDFHNDFPQYEKVNPRGILLYRNNNTHN